MRYCVYSRDRKLLKILIVAVYTFLVLAALACLVAMIISFEFPIAGFAFIFAVIALFPCCVKGFRFADRKYQITNEGIRVSDKEKNFYSWNEIYGIGIYPWDVAEDLQTCDKVICCFLQPPEEKIQEILQANKHLYVEMNQEKVLIIYYDETVYEELLAAYPGEIPDYYTGTCPFYGQWIDRKERLYGMVDDSKPLSK